MRMRLPQEGNQTRICVLRLKLGGTMHFARIIADKMFVAVICILLMFLVGCSPSLSESDRQDALTTLEKYTEDYYFRNDPDIGKYAEGKDYHSYEASGFSIDNRLKYATMDGNRVILSTGVSGTVRGGISYDGKQQPAVYVEGTASQIDENGKPIEELWASQDMVFVLVKTDHGWKVWEFDSKKLLFKQD